MFEPPFVLASTLCVVFVGAFSFALLVLRRRRVSKGEERASAGQVASLILDGDLWALARSWKLERVRVVLALSTRQLVSLPCFVRREKSKGREL